MATLAVEVTIDEWVGGGGGGKGGGFVIFKKGNIF